MLTPIQFDFSIPQHKHGSSTFRFLLLFIFISLVFPTVLVAQSASEQTIKYALIRKVQKQIDRINQRIESRTNRYLRRLQDLEQKIIVTIKKQDSLLAGEVVASNLTQYSASLKGVMPAGRKVHSSDSLSATLAFIDKNASGQVAGKQSLSQSVTVLATNLEKSKACSKVAQARVRELEKLDQNLLANKHFLKYRKEVYYFDLQVKEFENWNTELKKIEGKLIDELNKIPDFQAYLDHFLQSGQLQSTLASQGQVSNSMQGLQSRTAVIGSLNSRFGSSAVLTQALRSNLNNARSQLAEMGNTSFRGFRFPESKDQTNLPTDFRPNSQKVKTFFQRLEFGFNFSTVRAQSTFPSKAEIAISAAYRLNDRSKIGAGISYRIGVEGEIQKIRFSQQGVGLRSFSEYKIGERTSIYSGIEFNHVPSADFGVFHLNAKWQSSGLVGLSNKIPGKGKLNGNIQVLWDFLSYEQRPQTAPIIVRFGYTLK